MDTVNWKFAASSLKQLYREESPVSDRMTAFWEESAITVPYEKRGYDRKLLGKMLHQLYGRAESSESFWSDIDFLLYANITRGAGITRPDKMHYMKTPQDAARLGKLVKRYGIVHKVDAHSNSTTITLTRIAQCYPIRVLDLMKRSAMDLRAPVSVRQMHMNGFEEFKRRYCSMAYFAILPKNGKYLAFLKGLICYFYLDALHLNRNTGKGHKTQEWVMRSVLCTAQSAFESDTVREDVKEFYMQWFVGNLPEEIKDAWTYSFKQILPRWSMEIKSIFQQTD